jgi:hypothetical protein
MRPYLLLAVAGVAWIVAGAAILSALAPLLAHVIDAWPR